jgi:hypothetical protein
MSLVRFTISEIVFYYLMIIIRNIVSKELGSISIPEHKKHDAHILSYTSVIRRVDYILSK